MTQRWTLKKENIISEIYEMPNKSYFQEPVELKDLIDTRNIIQQFYQNKQLSIRF